MAPGRKAKKQKISQAAAREAEPSPLGALLPSASASRALAADEDEQALEEAVFGHAVGKSVWDDLDEEAGVDGGDGELDGEDDDRETGLERMTDENLFFVDDAAPTASTSNDRLPGSDDSDANVPSDEDEVAAPAAPAPKVSTSSIRKPAWHDPADEQLTVSLAAPGGAKRLRKLRDGKDEDIVSGLEYEARLRRQFEKMHPPPAWAVDARRKIYKKRARAGKAVDRNGSDISDASSDEDDSEEEGMEEAVNDLFRTTGSSKRSGKRGVLVPGDIDIDRVRDANQAGASTSAIVALGFHPNAQVLFSATSDRRLRLFQIDGTDNALLQTLHIPELPISAASYHPSGSSILLTGNRPFFLSYDLQTGQVIRSPRGLLGGGLGGTDAKTSGGAGGMERARFSPDGAMLAVGGRRGYVHLVDWGTGGVGNGGQVVGEVKMNVPVKGISWQKEGKELLTLGEDSEVYVWDVGMRRCISRWKDEGGFGANGLETDSRDKYTVVGSSTGIVNVYDSTAPAAGNGAERKALKAIGNLTTSITTMRFNHDSQILALASKTNKDQLKLVHLPTGSVFANWPTQSTPLHHVTDVSFSKGSEYVAIGNQRGKVLLYSLAYVRK